MSRKQTEKTIEFTTYQYDESSRIKVENKYTSEVASSPRNSSDDAQSEDAEEKQKENPLETKGPTLITKKVNKHFCGLP